MFQAWQAGLAEVLVMALRMEKNWILFFVAFQASEFKTAVPY